MPAPSIPGVIGIFAELALYFARLLLLLLHAHLCTLHL